MIFHFQCAVCGKGYKRLDWMSQHVESHYGVPSKGEAKQILRHIYKEEPMEDV